MERKEFISKSLAGSFALVFLYEPETRGVEPFLMTVTGRMLLNKVNIALPHEHITTDFSGAETVRQPQYEQLVAFNIILPWLKKLKEQGVTLITECTPNFIGRDVRLLRLLSKSSGLNIMTNTGYYAAVGQKYLPQHTYSETAVQLSNRFLKEWTSGIDGSGIQPGFIKLGVDKGPLKEVEKKLIRAAALTHLKSGLKIAIHTGDSHAAAEEFSILAGEGVAPEAFIWVHAQNDTTGDTQVELAKKGCWISLDGINASDSSIEEYGNHLLRLKKNDLLTKVLISHDDGWAVNRNAQTGVVSLDLFNNGNIVPYQTIFSKFKPYLREKGFTDNDFAVIMTRNPAQAYSIKVCRA
ncbi:MAG: hypothetical protein WKI04_09145 [Ferruginibacter sp.]